MDTICQHCKQNESSTAMSEIFRNLVLYQLLRTASSTMTSPTHEGPSSALISRIHHLQCLLERFPNTLPLNPEESNYYFTLDTDFINDEGVWYAFNRNLEVCFERHKLRNGETFVFQEHGDQYNALIKMMKTTVKVFPTKEHTVPFSVRYGLSA